MFLNTVENMTVAIRDPQKFQPLYKYFLVCHCFRGQQDHPLSFQWKHNVVDVSAKKKGEFRQGVSESTVNPNEKPFMANGWVTATFSHQVLYVVFSFLVGSLVVSLCGGSGSFMQ